MFQQLSLFIELIRWHKFNPRLLCLQPQDTSSVNMTSADVDLEAKVQDQLDKCQFTLTQQEALCDGASRDCQTADVSGGNNHRFMKIFVNLCNRYLLRLS